jgi:hypothetical protein
VALGNPVELLRKEGEGSEAARADIGDDASDRVLDG